MHAIERTTKIFDQLLQPDRWQLRAGVERSLLTLTSRNLESFLVAPSANPYGRRPLYRSESTELMIAMWAPHSECAPHDHGQSWGWVLILEGVATHSVYKATQGHPPALRKTSRAAAGRWLFAPKGLVHSMGNPSNGRLITLHAYAPPITGMRVYDIARCSTCVVRDDCGAWWPQSEHLIVQREIMMIDSYLTT